MRRKLILADDHAGFRKALRQYLTENTDFEIIAEVADGRELLSLRPENKCDIILLDISMPHLDGLAALAGIKECFPEALTIIVSGMKEAVYRENARHSGAAGFIFKDQVYDRLIPGISMVLAGQTCFPDAD